MFAPLPSGLIQIEGFLKFPVRSKKVGFHRLAEVYEDLCVRFLELHETEQAAHL